MATRAWTPADLGSSLLAWYDASDSSTFTLSGSQVSIWADKSVSSGARTGTSYPFRQTTAAYRPTVSTSGWLNSGVQTLALNGTSQFMTLSTAMPAYNDANGFSAMCAMQRPTDGSTGTFFSSTGGGSVQLRWQQDALSLLNNGNTQILLSTSLVKSPAQSPDFRISGCDIVSNTQKLWASGTQVGSSNYTGGFANGINELFGNLGQTEYFKGAAGELVLTSTVLSTANRQILEGYLSWKWGLVADLPASHPYKTAPPVVQTGTTSTRAWLPSDLGSSAVYEWWDASYGVIVNGSNVQNWTGRIRGLKVTANSSSNYATYSNTALNNKHGLTFNGYSTLNVAENGGFPKTDFAIMASGNNTDTGNYQQYICGWGDASGNAGRGFVKVGNKLGFDYYGGSYQGNNVPAINTGTAFNAIIGYSTGNNNTVYQYQDGVNYMTSTNLQQVACSGNGSFGVAYWPPYGSYWTGVLQQIVVLSRWITDTERQLLEGWDSWYTGKNGANLPSNHPYKSAAPTVSTGQATVAPNTWTPAYLQTPPFAWYDANEQLTITKNSSNQVSVWEDKSFNARHLYQATTAAMPTYSTLPTNGLPALYFNTSLMTANNLNLSGGNIATFAVLCPVAESYSGYSRIVVMSDGTTTADYTTASSLLAYTTAGGTIGSTANNQNRGNYITYTASQTNQFYSSMSGTTGTLWKDGTSSGVVTGYNALNTQAPKLVIGGRGESTPTNIIEPGNCYISEIIILNYIPSTSDQRLIEGYLAAKWNLQGYLPSNHPYKNATQPIGTTTRPFVPSDLGADVSFWFDASDKTTMTFTDSSQTAVTTWQSKTSAIKLSAPANSQAPGYSTLNGGYALYGGVSYRYMSTTANLGGLPTGNSASTMVFVGKSVGTYSASLVFGNNTAGDRAIGCVNPSGTVGVNANGNDTATNISYGSNGNIVVAEWDMLNPTPVYVYVDGTIAASVTRGTFLNTVPNGLNVLQNGSGPAGSGDIVQCAICVNRLLTTLERQRLEGWAAWQYNLVSQLPSSHPFKSAAPTITTIGLATYTGWTPVNLGVAPVKWFDAADNSTIQQSSGAVSQWNNKGSEPGHATNTTTSAQPTYSNIGFNSGPALLFNRGQMLSSVCSFNAPVVWCFAVLYATTDNAHARAVSLNYTGNTNDYDYNVEGNMAIVKSSGDGASYPGIERNGQQLTNASPYWKNPCFVQHGYDGTNGNLYVNGNATPSTTGAKSSNVTAQVLSIGGWGALNGGPNDGWTGPISEVIVLNYNPTTQEKQQIEGYLAWKWNLQGNLPAAHPYKNAAPIYSITTYVYQAFTPWDIKSGTLQGWYSANDPSTITTAAGSVTQWRDKSGKGRHLNQATGAYQPTYVANAENGHPGVVSNGGQFMKTNTGMAYPAQPLNFFILGTSAPSTGNTNRLVSLAPSGANDYSAGGIILSSSSGGSGALQYYIGGSYNAYVYFPSGPVEILEAYAISSSAVTVSVNGGFYPNGGTNTGIGTPVSLDQMAIFSATNGTGGWPGAIVEMLIVSGVLTTAEIQKIEGYLAWVNSQPALLPGNHPYKSTLPTLPYTRRRVVTIMS